MSKSLIKFIAGVGVVAFLQHFVKNHPAKEYAEDGANEIEKILDNEIGEKRSDVIQETIIPWIDEFYVNFRKTLLKN